MKQTIIKIKEWGGTYRYSNGKYWQMSRNWDGELIMPTKHDWLHPMHHVHKWYKKTYGKDSEEMKYVGTQGVMMLYGDCDEKVFEEKSNEVRKKVKEYAEDMANQFKNAKIVWVDDFDKKPIVRDGSGGDMGLLLGGTAPGQLFRS